MIPFHLVYGGEVVVPVEIEVTSVRVSTYGEDNGEKCVMKLDLVEESRKKVVARLKAYKQLMYQAYNRKVVPRSFQVGDVV